MINAFKIFLCFVSVNHIVYIDIKTMKHSYIFKDMTRYKSFVFYCLSAENQ